MWSWPFKAVKTIVSVTATNIMIKIRSTGFVQLQGIQTQNCKIRNQIWRAVVQFHLVGNLWFSQMTVVEQQGHWRHTYLWIFHDILSWIFGAYHSGHLLDDYTFVVFCLLIHKARNRTISLSKRDYGTSSRTWSSSKCEAKQSGLHSLIVWFTYFLIYFQANVCNGSDDQSGPKNLFL